MRPISILALTKSTGGLAFYNRMLLSALDPERFESHTVCLSDGGADYAADLQRRGLSADCLPMARYSLDPTGDLRTFRRIVAAVRARQPDVILCHGSKAGVLGRAAGRVTGTPAVYGQASLPFLRRVQGKRAPVYWGLEVMARGLGGTMVALTDHARDVTVAARVFPAERIEVIRTGVDVRRFHPAEDRAAAVSALGLDPARPVVGWMGRVEPQKAPLDFVDAVAAIADACPQAQFVMAGEGALKVSVLERIAAAGLQDRLQLLPWQEDPAAALRGFDVFVLSSHWEGLPMTLLEAMATGCAAVTTDVDGCSDAIPDSHCGQVVPPKDAGALAAAILHYVQDPAARASAGTAARERILAKFELSDMTRRWSELFQRLAGKEMAEAVREARA